MRLIPNYGNGSLAKAQFLRGVFYFHLVTVFGKVPIIDHVINGSDDPDFKPARDEIADVWDFIEEDFRAAIPALPKFEDYGNDELGRVAKEAAQGFWERPTCTRKSTGRPRCQR